LIRPFSGEDDKYPIGSFISDVDEVSATYKWSSVEIAENAKMALTGKAAMWIQVKRVCPVAESFRPFIVGRRIFAISYS
jgi:hypothetical protein